RRGRRLRAGHGHHRGRAALAGHPRRERGREAGRGEMSRDMGTPPGRPSSSPPFRRRLTPDEYVAGVLDRQRGMLSRVITLIESRRSDDRDLARCVLTKLLPHAGNSLRLGITGVPGAGKSTLIESLGRNLTGQGHRVAVLAIDPSSRVTGGSI